MSDSPTALIAHGEAALTRGDWQSAREAYSASLEIEETPEGMFGLGNALWWLGDLEGSLAHRERAYAAFLARPDPGLAFQAALLVILDYTLHIGNRAAARGWLGRARRLVERYDLEEMEGWLLLAEAGQEPRGEGVEDRLRDALERARTWEDADLELCAMSELGSVLVDHGKLEEGLALLDEAVAGALAGEGTPDAVVFTSCNMMVSCRNCADFERTVQWISAADRFVQRYGCPFLHAECRVVYGNVLVDTGDWTRAEDELKAAVAAAQSVPVYRSQALAGLAGLRLIQGRLDEAGRLIAGIEDHPDSVPIVARLRLMEGRPALAEAAVRRRLDHTPPFGLESGLLLELLGEAEIAQGNPGSAEVRGSELVEWGRDGECLIHTVRGHRLQGRALLSLGESDLGRLHLDEALSGLVRLGMPFEVARTRLLVAEAVQELQAEVATAAAKTSLRELEAMGANREADAAASFLRRLGAKPSRRRAGAEGPLSGREREVLALVGEGLSNPEIANRLFISRKTVEHHVARILAKLGLRNRAEAAAEAVKLSVGDAPPNR